MTDQEKQDRERDRLLIAKLEKSLRETVEALQMMIESNQNTPIGTGH